MADTSIPDPDRPSSTAVLEPGQASAGGLSIRKSLLFSLAERYASFFAQILTTAVLARILTPADYGVFTIAAVIVSITQSFRDFGAISFVIQERNLTEARLRTVYGISLLIGCIAAAAVAAASGGIAAFYQDEAVRGVLLVLSANFVLLPYGSLVLVLLRRDMQFDAILRINLLSVAASSMVSIALAACGFHALSLACGSLAGSVATCAMGGAMMRRLSSYRIRPSLKEWRHIVSFGTVATASVVINTIGEEAPQLLVGRFLGVEALGLYGRALGLVMAFDRLVSSGVAAVAVSALALRHRSGRPMREEVISGTVLITGVAWPFFAFLGLMAFPITRILFGDGWDAAVPLARILSVSGAFTALANLNLLALQAKGAVRSSLRLHLVAQPIMIAAVTFAAQFNLWAVAFAFIFGNGVFVIVSYRHLESTIDVSLGDVIVASWKSLVVTLASAAVPAAILIIAPFGARAIWFPFSIGVIGAGLGWVLGIAVSGHPLFGEMKGAVAALWRGFAASIKALA